MTDPFDLSFAAFSSALKEVILLPIVVVNQNLGLEKFIDRGVPVGF
jgi:hypothetical protein